MTQPFAQESLFGAPEGQYVRVALDTPVRREFSYWLPMDAEVQEGARVRVPFGPKERVGIVVGVDPHPPVGVQADRVRAVTAVLDQEPLLTPALLRLGRTIAEERFCSWGNALAAMLPASLRKNRARRTVTTVELVADQELDPQGLALLAEKYPKQEQALAYLKRAGGPVEMQEFLGRTGLSRSPLDTLAKKGFVRFERRQQESLAFLADAGERDQPPELTAQQGHCVEALRAALDSRRDHSFLLFGVTGSGKTEVYLHALEHCLAQGRGAIILVPEISLTPQTVARFRSRAGEVAVLHSGLTDAERHDQWVAIRSGRVRVVVGARSALFAPIPDLGLIVLDEEHETSFKQESVPRYHAREVALERARLEGAVAVLGSATPSLESWQAAQSGELKVLELPDRVAGGSLPKVHIVDLREQRPEGGHWLVISAPLREALQQALRQEEKAILFLNRRGYAPAWHCRDCGESVHCPTCDVPMTFHKWRKRAVCHLCFREEEQPTICPSCRSPRIQMVGVGTERAEEAILREVPEARIARMDRDTMLRREAYEETLTAFGRGEFNVLLGTQMVAKGLDFPDVTVVGVLNADTALHQPDFRASERCFNLVSQVSGRAGRSERGGQVVVQSFLPDHPAILHASQHDYVGFARQELEERREFRYPPYAAAVQVMLEGEDLGKLDHLAQQAAADLRAAAAPGVNLLGPAAPPVERVRGRYRRQILLKAEPSTAMQSLSEVLGELCQKQGVVVDRW